jgi:iron complex transport system permease protein
MSTARAALRPSRASPRAVVAVWLAGILLLLLFFGSFLIGRFAVSPSDLLALFHARLTGADHGLSPMLDTVVFQIRLPRVAAAMLVGAALAGAGATYQAMFRNPLVSPDILGVSAGAGLGAVLAIYLSLPVAGIQIMAFAVGLATVVSVYFISQAVRGHDPFLVLVLAGVVMGTLAGAGVSLLKYLADPYDQLPAITFWLLGSLAAVAPVDLLGVLPPIFVGLVPLYLLRWRMNLMSLGEEEARALGVDTARLRLVFIVAATLITAAAVSVSGVIGWVGLVIPHIARMLVGPDFARLLPASLLLGAGYLLVIDDLARSVTALEIPLGVLTAALGAPFFLWLLVRARHAWQ